jgi:phenylalanyl-tRNA synthetase beta chain
MKVSLNLLKQFVSFKQTPEQLAELLTDRAFEVEGVIELTPKFKGIISARVEKIEPHPNADRLRVITLTDGQKTIDPVVCGAFNFKESDVVALALPGAYIPGGDYTLEPATIRGVTSQGMICAKSELGIGEEEGKTIWVMESDTPLGKDVKLLLPADTLLEVALPANRPDLYSHYGIARELAAVLNVKLKQPKIPKLTPSRGKQPFSVTIKDKGLCPKFVAICMRNIEVKPSPQFIQDTLRALGIRPINNVVDITNYVTAELGQPLHAFDSKGVIGDMVIRLAKSGEAIQAINHKQYRLDSQALVIADQKKPLDVAGVMGGLESEIADATEKIILTAATFNGPSVRQTSKKLGLRTEASALFEKGLPTELASWGASRAMELLIEHANAKVDQITVLDYNKSKPIKIKVAPERINRLLGADYSTTQIKQSLQRYQIPTTSNGKTLLAAIPWWRTDLHDEADLAEEVVRIQGVNGLNPQPLNLTVNPTIEQESLSRQIRLSKELWARLGYNEVQNYSFISEQDILKFKADPKQFISVTNPLSSDQGYLKRHLLIPLLKNVRQNQYQADEFKLFEIGKQYLSFGQEPLLLSGIGYSKTKSLARQLAEIKGDCVKYLENLGLTAVEFKPANDLWLEVKVTGAVVGLVGVVQAELTENFNIDRQIVWFKLELEKILPLSKDHQYVAQSKYPTVQRDVSVVISKEIPWSDIEQLFTASSPLLTEVTVAEADYLATDKDSLKFHQSLARQGQKNLLIRATFQAPDRTLTEAEISGILEQIVLKLKQKLGAEIR